MKIVNIKINNFRGVKHCDLNLPEHAVLVGDNNIGKSTILEAIDLVLGPERLSKRPVIDEHDFYVGKYLDNENNPIEIKIDIILIGLNNELESHFRNNIEWWDTKALTLLNGPPPEATDRKEVVSAVRLGFRGYYDVGEDDFAGKTIILSPQREDGEYDTLKLVDKRQFGFLYLRTLRTGRRALSLERGSLLDIILKLQELKPHMWEDVLSQLRDISVVSNPELGISDILANVQQAVRDLVPVEFANVPAIRISEMTREHLRHVLTVFLGTGTCDDDNKEYLVPYHHQGTGTINALVLTLLSMIADLKPNVIFAMEEPEIAIPPYTQKRIIHRVVGKSAQAIFTSHSPYVMEEFEMDQIIVVNRKIGELTGIPAQRPPYVKQKKYRDEIKRRFCESLLARKVLIVEGDTEYNTYPIVARKLEDINPDKYASLESMGISIICAETENNIPALGEYFRRLGKTTYAIFDKQSNEKLEKICHNVDFPYVLTEKGFEKLVVNNTNEKTLRQYAAEVIKNGNWPTHIEKISQDSTTEQLHSGLCEYFMHKKAENTIADCLCMCILESDFPSRVLEILQAIRNTITDISDGTM